MWRARRHSGTVAVGAPAATSGTSGERHPAEGPLVDEPQLGPAVGEVEPGVQVLLARRVGRARRAAGRSCPGGRSGPAGGRRGPPAPARGTCRGAGAAVTASPVSRAARSAGPGDVTAGDRGCRGTRPRAMRASDDVVLAGRGGRPRPRAAQASRGRGLDAGRRRVGRRCRGGAASARRASWPRDLGGLLLGLLLAATGALAEHLVADDRAGVEDLLVVRALLGRRGTPATPRRGRAVSSCRLVFQSRPAPSVAEPAHQRVEQVVHERGGRGHAASTGRPCR